MEHIKRHKWIIFYLLSILAFSAIYYFLPREEFKYNQGFGDWCWDWAYFSVVTITTLGYGDITPVGKFAKILTSFESVWGLFLLGMFLNGEAQNAIELRDKKYVSNALNHSFCMLAFIEEYLVAALGQKSDQRLRYKDRFQAIAVKLKYQPEKFNFTAHILDNIYWGARHAVNDFRLIALDSKALSDDAFIHVSAIITNLDRVDNSPIDDVTTTDRKPSQESMQHKMYVAFTNAVILIDAKAGKKHSNQ